MTEYEYGCRIYLGDEEALEEINSSTLSEGFKLLTLFAKSLDCTYLKLDSDGPIYEEFPRYDW